MTNLQNNTHITETLKSFLIKTLEEKGATDIILYNDKEYNLNYNAIIATARSTKNAASIADYISLATKKQGYIVNIEGITPGSWVLLDFQDIILNIFHEEARRYYNLEELYDKNKKLQINSD